MQMYRVSNVIVLKISPLRILSCINLLQQFIFLFLPHPNYLFANYLY